MFSIRLFAIALISSLLAEAATASVSSNITVSPRPNSVIGQIPSPDDIDDAVDDAVDDVIDDAIDDAVDDVIDDAVDDAVDDVIDDAVDDVIDDAVDDVIDDAVDDVIDDAIDDVIDDAIDDVIDDAVDDVIDDAVDDVIDDAIDDAVDDAVDDLTGENQLECQVANDASTIIIPPFSQEGRLEEGDSKLKDNSFYDIHTFGGCAEQTVTINLESQDFDPYLAIIGPDSEEPIGENDDINDSDQNSRLEITLPVNGVYSIVVNSYEPEGQGAYTVSIR